MNRRIINQALFFLLAMAGTAVWGADPSAPPAPALPATNAPAATNVIGPKIQFETMVHDFGRAKSGDVVKYSYIFTNVGDQVLELTGVQACGCITADWTRKVEPGKTGAVPIAFNSANYGGQIIKTVTVTCNDKTNPRPMLQFKGTIWRPIDVNPQFAVLNLTADAPLAFATIVITNNLPDPIDLSPPQSSNPAFRAELKTNEVGKDFRLIIAPVSPLPSGNAQTQITLKTSSTNMPMIVITAFANVQPAVAINPPQIVLPAGPLAQPQTNTITFTDNSTNSLTLSEPAVSATGVDVQLRETLPGRQFAATLTFPQGFEIAQGQKTELSVKSSLPLVPTVKVPILQMPRPALANITPRIIQAPPPVPPKVTPTLVQPPQPAPPKVPPVKTPSVTRTNRHRVLPPVDLPPLPP